MKEDKVFKEKEAIIEIPLFQAFNIKFFLHGGEEVNSRK